MYVCSLVNLFLSFIDTEEEKIDVLVNNAGVMCQPKSKTVDGIELHLATNYVGKYSPGDELFVYLHLLVATRS